MKLSEQQWLELSRLLDEALALAPDERRAWHATLTDAPGPLRTTLGELLSREATSETDAFGADHPLTKLAARLESNATRRITPAR
jgi:hypothetical protein